MNESSTRRRSRRRAASRTAWSPTTREARSGSPVRSERATTFAAQFDGAADNLVLAIKGAGGTPDDLVWLQVFVTDVNEYRESAQALAPVWRKHFGRRYPAMGLFGVTGLAVPEAKVELMGIAVIGG